MLRRSPVNREPYTTRALPRSTGLSSLGQSSGSYSRSASCTRTYSPVACSNPVRTAAPLPRLWSCMTMRTVLSPSWRSTSRVPSLLPSSTTMISRSTPSGSSTARMRRSDLDQRVALVEDRHDDRELAQLRRCADGHARPRARSSRYHSCMRRKTLAQRDRPAPSRAASRARVMSGRRRVGSPTGSGSNTISDVEPVTSRTTSDELEHRDLVRVADVDRIDDVRVEERDDPAHFVGDVAERPGLTTRRRRS